MSSKTTTTKAQTPVAKNGSRATKKSLPEKLEPGFKVDKSATARAFAKAVKLTHKRLYGEK
ncbi:MAG: hypothetical protein HY231_18315 [Acidobacteria bacterium]|nr:hypothetical protein [Acidobacteriota bacterium]